MTATSMIMQFLPIVLLIGVWIFFMTRMKNATPAIDAQQVYQTAHLEETRRMNQTLERIAVALEERRSA